MEGTVETALRGRVVERASWCAVALLWALVPAASLAQPQAGAGAAASPLRIEQVRVSPERPGTDTLCQLAVRLRNGGEKPMYAFAVDVKLNGTPLPVYERQLFLQAVPAGEAAELRLFNFWTTETGRARPADGRLVVEVTVREALWLDITEETPAEETEGGRPSEPVEVWTPAGTVPGLPVRAAVTLELQSLVSLRHGSAGALACAVSLVSLVSAHAGARAAPAPPPAGDSQVIFREVANEVGLDFVHFNGMVGKLYFPEVLSGGAAVFDYDGDGDLDLYLGQGSLFEGDRLEDAVFQPKHPLPLTGRLYRNDLERGADGAPRLRFTDVTQRAGFQPTAYNMGVATGDYDNDGDPDLYLLNLGSNNLLRNEGDGTFTDVTAESRSDDRQWSAAGSFFDYDRDGWLDLFVGNYTEWRVALHKQCTAATGAHEYCGPLSYALAPNTLLHSRRDGSFENVSAKALLEQRAASTLGVVAGDFDDDGWPDVYVANDQVDNQMWMNRRDGTFVDDAQIAGSAVDAQGQPQASMGVVAGDLDGDGDEDLFMTHLRMEMNTIYENDGTGLFRDVARESGLGQPSWTETGFGIALFDYDNDGVVDLYIANGAVKRIEEQLRAGDPHPVHEENELYRGRGSGKYEEIPAALQEQPVRSEVGRGVAAGDLDNDGDTDLVVANNAGPVRLLRDEVGSRRPWLGLRLLLRDHPRDATGAKVALYRTGRPTQWRRLRTDGSYVSANDPRLLFGLGDGPAGDDGPGAIEKLWVRWPDGSVEEFGPRQIVVGAYTTLRQGSGSPGR